MKRPSLHPVLTVFSALLMGLLLPLSAAAQFDARRPDDIVQVQVLEGWRRADGSHVAGLLIRLAPGWKTYWRAPGEGGIPPHLQLRDRRGLLGVEMHWPVPEVFNANGLRSVGYRSDVVLPLELTLADGQGDLQLAGRLDLGVCQDICMPVSVTLRATLPAGGRPDPRIVAALADRPLTAAEAGAGRITCVLTPISDGLQVEVAMLLPQQGRDEAVVIELPDPSIWISEADTRRSGGILYATADIVPADAGPFALDRSSLRMTVLAEGRAVEMIGCQGR
ncbi:MAG: hypothetical protein COW55_09860 [Rhodobacteraceae bacterium CG17_big_fil_post_rev_8_21_14_2_50_65_11]|nr:MAG: hypothetical protein COW55_09860 [Rhodobacteraceae bacterium CG17_big_fil_post_rev_8_21_14_2_50_65_11]